MDAKIAFQLVAEAYKALDAWQWNWSHKDFLTEAIDFSKDAKVIEEGVYDFALNEGSVKGKAFITISIRKGQGGYSQKFH